MRVAVLGTGMVGRAIAGKLSELGHEVVVGTRDPAETLARQEPDFAGNPPFAAWQAQHPQVRLAGLADAAAHGELVVNATAGAAALEALRQAGEANLDGKVLVDVANPLDFSQGMPPSLSVVNTDCLGPAHRVRLAGRGRPRRHQHRPRARDADGPVAAADGQPADPDAQDQGRPLTWPSLTAATASSAASVGLRPTRTPAASRASALAWAVPLDPEMIAPAWPMRLPGGASNPAM